MPRLVPDREARGAFIRDLRRVPFAFLEAILPAQSEWEQMPAAYVQLSKGYDEMAIKAARRCWTVRRARLHHLAIVSDPATVADRLQNFPCRSKQLTRPSQVSSFALPARSNSLTSPALSPKANFLTFGMNCAAQTFAAAYLDRI